MERLAVLREEMVEFVRVGRGWLVNKMVVARAHGGDVGAQGGDELGVVPLVMLRYGRGGLVRRLRGGREGGREGRG